MINLKVLNKNKEIILDKEFEREIITYPSNLRTDSQIVKVTTFLNIQFTEEEIINFYKNMGEINDILTIEVENMIYQIESSNVVITRSSFIKNFSLEIKEELKVNL